MNMKMRKRAFTLLIAAVLFGLMQITAYAKEVPDMSRTGSIQITMRRGDRVVSGGSLTIHRVGDIFEDDGNYSFVLNESYADSGLSLADIQSAELAKQLSQYAKTNRLEGTTKTIGDDGTVTFDGLEPGLYMLVQNRAASGYYAADPFLLGLPMPEGETYLYDVVASPKVELRPSKGGGGGGGSDPGGDPTPPGGPGEPDVPGEPGDPAGPSGDSDAPVDPLFEIGDPLNPRAGLSMHALPQTGQLNWPVPVLVVAGLVLFSAGWVMRFGKIRKNGYEK